MRAKSLISLPINGSIVFGRNQNNLSSETVLYSLSPISMPPQETVLTILKLSSVCIPPDPPPTITTVSSATCTWSLVLFLATILPTLDVTSFLEAVTSIWPFFTLVENDHRESRPGASSTSPEQTLKQAWKSQITLLFIRVVGLTTMPWAYQSSIMREYTLYNTSQATALIWCLKRGTHFPKAPHTCFTQADE